MKLRMPAFLAAALALFFASGGDPKPEAAGPSKPPQNPKAPPWNPPAPGPALDQHEVTPEMTAWAQSLVSSGLPMHTVVPKAFDGRTVLGRVEWHTVQARTGKHGLFRAASLYREV